MRWIVPNGTLVVSLSMIALGGCSRLGWGKGAKEPVYTETPTYYEPVGTTDYQAAAPLESDTVSSLPPVTPSGSARYHVVARKDTLYALARQYYQDQSRWKDIYEANRSDISDPNRIRVGQRLMIP